MDWREIKSEFITTPIAAKMLGVGADKIRCAIESGELRAANFSNGQIRPRYKIHREDLAAFVKGRQVQVGSASE
jgi:excisionase family DNA binding protein